MQMKRIIPCLDVDNGRVVKGTNFVDIRDAGDPVELAARYEVGGADELIFLTSRLPMRIATRSPRWHGGRPTNSSSRSR